MPHSSNIAQAALLIARDPRRERGRELFKWFPVIVGLLALYVPSYWDLARVFWVSEVGAHGPIILAVVCWLVWRKRNTLLWLPDHPSPVAGWLLVALSVCMYVIGRSQQFVQFEIGSQIPLLFGLLLALRGKTVARQLRFPILFMAFLVPLPNSLLDAILLPLKQYVSIVVEHVLYWAGYPVARSGVVLSIGAYQLLIANACSGLNSMVALTGIGLLFMYLMHSQSRLYNGLLLVSILPIAFLANIARVVLLMLVTYYFGDRAGHQLHDHAGYLEVAFAFGAFFLLDAMLVRTLRVRAKRADPALVRIDGHQDEVPRVASAKWSYRLALVVMLGASVLAAALAPTRYAVQKGEVHLEALIPRQFGGWREVESTLIPMDLTPRDGEAATMDQPYDQTLQRTYVRSDGQRVMLALAYGRAQRQEVKIHRPELCYVAQGFEVRRRERATLTPGEDLSIDAVRLIARRPHRLEPVTYWVRIGSTIPQSAWQSRWEILTSGLQGYIPDGMLVRVSQALPENDPTDGSYEVQNQFLADLLADVGPGTRRLLAGPRGRS